MNHIKANGQPARAQSANVECVRAVRKKLKPNSTIYFPNDYLKNVTAWLRANHVECVIYANGIDALYFYTKSEVIFKKAMDELPALLLLPLEVE